MRSVWSSCRRPRMRVQSRHSARIVSITRSACALAFGARKGVRITPWGSETPIRSRREAVVLVDEPAEQVPPANVTRVDGDRVTRFGQRWGEAEGAMRAPAVVVLGVG